MMADYTTAGKNLMVDAMAAAATHIALFDETGTELTGGSPAYARKAVTWDAAASGATANDASLTFDVPASTTVRSWGAYTALSAGTLLIGPKALTGGDEVFGAQGTAVAGVGTLTFDITDPV
jgi:hypothetical protein